MTISGRFTWHELHTRDYTRAVFFYQALLGWEAKVGPGPSDSYGQYGIGGQGIAEVTKLNAPARVPAHWLPYLAVIDVDAKLEQALSLGARVVRQPKEVLDGVHSAVVADPQGALFGLRSQRLPYATESAVPPMGSFCWNELLTSDAAAAQTFYSKLFGYSTQAIEAGPGTYWVLSRGALPTAGVTKHPQNVHPHWLPYLAVPDVDTVTERALALGASLYFPPRDIPQFGRFSAIDDPEGAGICLFRGNW